MYSIRKDLNTVFAGKSGPDLIFYRLDSYPANLDSEPKLFTRFDIFKAFEKINNKNIINKLR